MASGDDRSSVRGTAIGIADPVAAETRSAGAADETCPSCDSPGAWTMSRRHRFNPFGGVTILVLAFWVAIGGWLTGIGLLPALGVALIGVGVIASQRTALVCQVCGYVKAQG